MSEHRYEVQLNNGGENGYWYCWTRHTNREAADYEFNKTVVQSLPGVSVRLVELMAATLLGPTPGTHDGHKRGPFEGW